MRHTLLKSIIYDQHEIIRRAVIVPREYEFEEHANYILTGLRRAGKSTILYGIAQKLIAAGADWNQIIFINFEDERLAEFTAEDFNDILLVQSEMSERRGYFFFDEIQNVAGWERFARRLADAKERVYLTGSNAAMLSRDMEARLGGRYLTKQIAPYNFREFLDAKGIERGEAAILSTRGAGRIRSAFRQYFHFGGFPESLAFRSPRLYVENVYQKILLGDIVVRNEIRNADTMRILIKKIAETVRSDVSYSKLWASLDAIGLKCSKESVIHYVDYAQQAYLLFSIRNYAARFAEREGNPKYYFGDNGLLYLFLTQKDTALLENLAAVSLYKKYGEQLFYLKSAKTGIDVDFYLPQEKLAVQVAYSIEGAAREREVANLVKLARFSGEANRYRIITYEEKETIETEGIRIEVIPIYEYLLAETYENETDESA